MSERTLATFSVITRSVTPADISPIHVQIHPYANKLGKGWVWGEVRGITSELVQAAILESRQQTADS